MSGNTSPTEIIEVHVPYEIDMLLASFHLLKTIETSEWPLLDNRAKVTYNVLIESFCVHARNLIDFFQSKQGMRTAEFTDDYKPGFVGKIDADLVRKLNSQIAHITWKRTDNANDKIQANDRAALLIALLAEIDLFGSKLKQERQKRWPYVTTPNSIRAKDGSAPVDSTGDAASGSVETASLTLGSSKAGD